MTIILWALFTLLIPIIQSRDYTGFVHIVISKCYLSNVKTEINYFSYKVFKVQNTDNVRKVIDSFNIYELNGVDIMLINRNTTHALVPPQVEMNFKMLLNQMNASYSVDENVQRLFRLI